MQDAIAVLARLTDAEVEQCLNGLLKGVSARQPVFGSLIQSPRDLRATALELTSGVALDSSLVDVLLGNDSKVIRGLLVEMAGKPEFSVSIVQWSATVRPTLIEPVTTMLVAAGIVMLLSTHIKVEYDRGKKQLRVKVEKKPTSDGILRKILHL